MKLYVALLRDVVSGKEKFRAGFLALGEKSIDASAEGPHVEVVGGHAMIKGNFGGLLIVFHDEELEISKAAEGDTPMLLKATNGDHAFDKFGSAFMLKQGEATLAHYNAVLTLYMGRFENEEMILLTEMMMHARLRLFLCGLAEKGVDANTETDVGVSLSFVHSVLSTWNHDMVSIRNGAFLIGKPYCGPRQLKIQLCLAAMQVLGPSDSLARAFNYTSAAKMQDELRDQQCPPRYANGPTTVPAFGVE